MRDEPERHSPTITRRELIKLAAIGGASLAACPGRAGAAEDGSPRPDRQGAGFYRFALGDAEIFLISDGTFPFDPPFPRLAVNSSEEAVRKALEKEFVRYDDVQAHVNALLFRNGKRTVLVDTGTGPASGAGTGKLLASLANAGIAPGEVSAVIITHMHGDHFGGLLDESGKPAFPRAELFIHEKEHAFWSSESPDLSESSLPKEQQSRSIERAKAVLRQAKWTRIGRDEEIVPGISAVLAPGHTPGHMALIVDGGGSDRLFYITDTVHHHAIQMPSPETYVAFDVAPEQAVASRKRILERAASDRLLVSGAHLPFPAVGHVRKSAEGYAWVPAVWKW